MILAAGLTPAWQQILCFDRFQMGEVNRAADAHWCSSGKVLNVGLALHALGGPSKTLSVLGGLPQAAIEAEFERLGAPSRWISSTAATRTCTTILDRGTGRTTELVQNAVPLSEQEVAQFYSAYAEEAAAADVVVLTGSLPAGTPWTCYRELLGKTRCRAILDAQGPELLSALEMRPYLVKPNREELARTLNRKLATEADLQAAMRELNERGATWVVLTQGKDAVWMSSKSEMYRFQPPEVKVVNPIGCGDCLAAGIAWGLDHGREPPEAVQLGMRAAAENAAQLLPARLSPFAEN